MFVWFSVIEFVMWKPKMCKLHLHINLQKEFVRVYRKKNDMYVLLMCKPPPISPPLNKFHSQSLFLLGACPTTLQAIIIHLKENYANHLLRKKTKQNLVNLVFLIYHS